MFKRLTNLARMVANLNLPPKLVGYMAARGVLQRYRQNIMIEREMIVLPHLLAPGDWAVDIGAAIGDYTLRLARLVGESGRVFAFEPIPQNFNKLKGLIEVANLAGIVEIHQVALGEECGTTTMFLEQGAGGWLFRSAYVLAGTCDADRGRKIQVPMETLDRYFADCTRIRFVKCDAEGMELPILQGGKRLLRNSCPHLLVEVSDLQKRYGYDKADLVRFLEELGYQPLRLDESQRLRATDVSELMRLHHCNCFFVNRDAIQPLLFAVNSDVRER